MSPMPASILPQNQDEKELFNAISSFSSFLISTMNASIPCIAKLFTKVAIVHPPLCSHGFPFRSQYIYVPDLPQTLDIHKRLFP